MLGMGCRGIIGSAMVRNRNRTIEEFLRGKVVKGRLYVCGELRTANEGSLEKK